MSNKVISLFSGIGGMDLGFEAAGFDIAITVERDAECRKVLRRNRPNWRTSEPGEIDDLSSRVLLKQSGLRVREAALLIGGPPCQPFSKSQLWVKGSIPGLEDSRAATIDQFFRVLNDTLPRAVVIENVSAFAGSSQNSAFGRIEEYFRAVNVANRTRYWPVALSLNAADYGVPQSRRRVFIVAERSGQEFRMPPPSHAAPGTYEQTQLGLETFRTAWDAIGDLDTPDFDSALKLTGKWADLIPSIPEGQNYLWHTEKGGGLRLFGWRTRYWSFLLKLSKRGPSWTLQASPGPATGPFHWRNRRLSIREMARIQTFPDSYVFCPGYREGTRQIGNAVPPALSEVLAQAVMQQFFDTTARARSLFQLQKNRHKPRRHPAKPVPEKYLDREASHPAHPGIGRGPRAQGAWSWQGAEGHEIG